eukprot:4648428-Pyramimonas_sp.AAC.1
MVQEKHVQWLSCRRALRTKYFANGKWKQKSVQVPKVGDLQSHVNRIAAELEKHYCDNHAEPHEDTTDADDGARDSQPDVGVYACAVRNSSKGQQVSAIFT